MYGTYCRLGVPVWASARAVLRAASRKLKRKSRYARAHRKDRHAFYRAMLQHHSDAQALCRQFRL